MIGRDGLECAAKSLRDAETIVRELHSLLEKAGGKGPFVWQAIPLVVSMFANTRENFRLRSFGVA